jgi:benzoyl-CoA reductase subunit B
MAEKYELQRNLLKMLELAPEESEFQFQRRTLTRILNAVDQGEPLVYHNFTLLPELFMAMDVAHMMPEWWALNRMPAVGEYACCEFIDAAQEAGVPAELCSADKTLIGELLREELPPPDLIVTASFPCDNERISFQIVEHLTGAPSYLLDCPYWMDEGEALEYWVNQYKGLISFLEDHTGKKMDYDRLKEIAEESNRCLEYYLEALELIKLVPMPGPVPRRMGVGLPEGTAFMKAQLDDLKQRVARGDSLIPDERVRVIWSYMPIAWDATGLPEWMREELGAVIPVGMISYFPVEPEDPATPETVIRGLAKRTLQSFMGRQGRGSADIWIEDTLYTYEQWKGDCVILSGHAGCKWLHGHYGLFKDIARERGIPSMLYDVDVFDPRVTSREESHLKIEQFLDTVMPRDGSAA